MESEQAVEDSSKELTLSEKIKKGQALTDKKIGRPPGSLNKNTLFKEAMTDEFRSQSEKQVRDVLEVLFKKAKGGDMKAIKLVMDRLISPVRSEDQKRESGQLVVNISVGSMEEAQAIEINSYEKED